MPVLASAQKLSKIPQRNEIVRIESGEDPDAEALEVFDSPVNGESRYYLYKEAPGTGIEIQGCLAFGFPKDEKMETVTVTYRKVLLSRMLEFSVRREGYIRSAHVQKSDFGSLVSSVKLHHKLFPKK